MNIKRRCRALGVISEKTGTPTLATLGGGFCAAVVSLVIQLEVLVEMMSIGKWLTIICLDYYFYFLLIAFVCHLT